MKCYGCGIEKDLSKMEVYPYPEDERLMDGPIEPMFVVECQGEISKEHPNRDRYDYRAVVICHECFKKLDPDMWIGESHWVSITPRIQFDELPHPSRDYDKIWLPQTYPDLVT